MFGDIPQLSAAAPLNKFLSQRSDGQENMPRWAASNATCSMSSGFTRFSYLVANKTEAVTKISLSTGNTAAGATPTLVRYGLYSVASNGDLLQLSAITSDTSIFATALTNYPRAMVGSVTLTAGQLYVVASIVVTAATAPTLTSVSASTGGENALSPKINGILTGQTDLLSSYTAAQVAQTQFTPYVAVLY